MILLTINGKERQLDGETDLTHYLETLGINLRAIAVAHNGTVLRREELSSVVLREGDQAEIVRAVGGG